MAGLPSLKDILEEYELVDAEDRYRLLIDLGRQLEPMPEALKTEATRVRGCSASVWVYPPAAEVAELDVVECLAPFELAKHLSANRTQGVPNMIALVKQTAERYAAR